MGKQQKLKREDKENLFFEEKALLQGAKLICGVDEAGRGPVAGPVVAAACLMPLKNRIDEVKDSKLLSKKKRITIFNKITTNAISIGIGLVDSVRIDKINILNASLEAMKNAVLSLRIKPDHILTDGINLIPVEGIRQETIIHGDRKSYLIASASIIAKVVRDRLMYVYDLLYPGYYFSKNAGYLTKEHRKLISKLGITSIHRKSFKPIK